MNPVIVIKRTDEAFERYRQENAVLFASLGIAFPGMGDTLADFAKAAFYAGCNYEREHIDGAPWKYREATQ